MSDLNLEVMKKNAEQIQHEIVAVLLAKEPSKEMSTALIMALANLLAIVATTVVPDNDMATDVIVAAISRAMKECSKYKQKQEGGHIIVYEISADTEATGE